MDGSAGSGAELGQPDRLIFRDAIRWVIQAEGGDKLVEDTGGLTRWGISERAHPGIDIRALTRQQAEDIYWDRYWQPIRGNALPQALALVVFDTAVNMGVRVAVELLQSVLRVTVDGKLGPETLAAAKLFLPRHELVAQVLEIRLRRYEHIAKAPTHARYLYGWRMRTMRLALEAGRWRGL